MRYQGENVLVLENNSYIEDYENGTPMGILFDRAGGLHTVAVGWYQKTGNPPIGIKVADSGKYNNIAYDGNLIDRHLKGEPKNELSIVYEGIVQVPVKFWLTYKEIHEGDFVGIKFFGNPDNPTLPCYVPVDTFDANKVLGIALSSAERYNGLQYIDLLLLNPQITPVE